MASEWHRPGVSVSGPLGRVYTPLSSPGDQSWSRLWITGEVPAEVTHQDYQRTQSCHQELGLGSCKHCTDAGGSRVGKFISCVASDWLEHPMTASDWLLMLRGANRETCNRKLKHQQRLTYLAKTAAHHAAVQSAALFHLFPSSEQPPLIVLTTDFFSDWES